MKKIKFSIIVPAFNVEEYIERCINSILSQDYDYFELILINDGSTDNTLEVLKKYKNNKLKIFSKKNGGLSSARNYGILKATGDYIWFVDGDDYIEPNSLVKIANIISKNFSDVICFEYNIVTTSRKIHFHERRIYGDVRDFPLISVSACTKVFKRELFVKTKALFCEGILYEDLELIPYILCISEKIYFFSEALYNYVQRENSIMNSKKLYNDKKDDKFVALDNLITKFKKLGIYEKYITQLEFLVIKHLLFVYLYEISIYSNKMFKRKCKKVLGYLDLKNKKWYKNEYLRTSSIYCRLYTFMFRHKQFNICKLVMVIKNKFIK